MSNWMRRVPARTPAWVVASAIALVVVTFNFGLPFIVRCVWPGVNLSLLMVGNMFLGIILGTAGVLGFLSWRWEVRR